MIHRIAIALALTTLAAPQYAIAQASPAPAPAASAPDSALTARFSAFLTDVLAGKLPSSGISETMKSKFTPDLISQVDNNLSPLGAFQSLQFVRKDNTQGFAQYHYVATFAKGTVPLIFVLDSDGNIAGFFKEQ
ncbi:MAG: DUF3887 domain-containing protein [Candidatus Cybelea sp.]